MGQKITIIAGVTTIKRPTLFYSAGLITLLILVPVSRASADQNYSVSGRDSYQIGLHGMRTDIAYSGKQHLTISKSGKTTRFAARVHYDRIDEGGRMPATAAFDSVLNPSGDMRDERNRDPDYLTVLNQPFSVQLDLPTLRDLSHLRGRIPFDLPSRMTGSPLHGFLRKDIDARIGGRSAVGVTFEASGQMLGPLPDRPDMSLRGSIRMTGSAFYQTQTALLMALEATLQISGTLVATTKRTPVTIVYKRNIRADSSSRH
ncbi:MAG: hypothetical protein M3Z14_01400 [Candidatus Eremiobacteraeota bacterium]|nr:hypothetical protein [Candidatus Eremiobacteraeota bacterium]